jgi:hypothetical protein
MFYWEEIKIDEIFMIDLIKILYSLDYSHYYSINYKLTNALL